ncbi:MAG: hypothetical protein H8E29_11105 [Anaerolineales bacterium]|uniref:Uncharacterized protein n=1 Tax=Candidatus Desulfolinea nitratireducens TaxID=2841698 RepID=A0A8J6NLY9_9CHLR|nr:hypothetical protein [Candidatus Desulfolinea nitratireducens]
MDMDILSKRIKRAVESVLDNEALAGGLDESAGYILQQWGIKNVTRIAAETETLSDDQAEEAMYPHLKASRRLMRAIRVWVQHEKDVPTDERERLWGKIEKRAKVLYGEDLILPSPGKFSGDTQAEFIKNLLEWLDNNRML